MPNPYAPCTLCPRRCGANRRTAPAQPAPKKAKPHPQPLGACGQSDVPKIVRAAPHHWEEPCISGTRGSGAVFFSGCPLGCSFCQNAAISRGGAGQPQTPARLAQTFLALQAAGVHNLNLVTAGHFAPGVAKALALAKKQGLALPVVFNSGGYEAPETLEMLRKYVDIWLLDVKFSSAALAGRLCHAPNYPAVAQAAARWAAQAAGPPQWGANGLLRSGLLVRLLVLPGQAADAMAVLDFLAQALPRGGFLLSLMCQYTPMPGLEKPFNRPLSTYEYRKVQAHALSLGLTQGYSQSKASAGRQYIPDFS